MPMGSALVLDVHLRHGVVAARCLGDEGVRVTAGSPCRWSAGRFSRHVDRYFTYPAPREDPEGFVEAILDELAAGDYDMLLPIHEETVETVLRNRSRFEAHAAVPFPAYDKLRIGLDKERTVEAAREVGVPHPETVLPGEGDLDDVEETIGYPVVAKARRGEDGDGVVICDTREELERAQSDLRERYGPVLYQEFVPNGGEHGVYTLYGNSGELTALTVQHRLRTNPPSGGTSTYRETVSDPELVALADEFLTAVDWRGLAMAEFRIDARTGEPQLIEVNPRLWGSLALSVYAGANFPHLLYRIAVGDDPEPELEYDVGVQARCLFTDALQVLEREDTSRAVSEFLTPASKPCRYDVVSGRDPLPVLGQFLFWGAALLEEGRGAVPDS